jgi:SAM-dependent methyltransferase
VTGDVANVEQADSWNGAEGQFWAENDDRFNLAIRAYSECLLAAAALSPDEDVLDIGCGCGESARHAARAASAGTAHGVDLSRHMLERARGLARAEGLTNVTFTEGDAQVYDFVPESVDVVISRFGIMFFQDPRAAFRNIKRALRPGGRVAFVVWRPLAENEWLTVIRAAIAAGRDLPAPPIGAPGPFGLADEHAASAVLADAGFRDIRFEAVDVPFVLGRDVEDAYAFVQQLPLTRGMLEGIDAADRDAALDALHAVIAAHETGHGVEFGSGGWLITARRD